MAWLEKYAMYTKPRAEQRVKFIEQYRSYVINYNLGKDLVRAYVEKKMGRDKTPHAPLARVRGAAVVAAAAVGVEVKRARTRRS